MSWALFLTLVCFLGDHTTARMDTPNGSNSTTFGECYNYWKFREVDSIWDTTRSQKLPVSSPKLIPMLGSRRNALIEPNRTAFLTVDMQNFFLHPSIAPDATLGRNAVKPTLDMIQAFRQNGMKVLWVNWGIDDYDLRSLPPALLDGFADDHKADTTFCSDMGRLEPNDGTAIDMGKKLCRGSWNARPWGPLDVAMSEGIAAGTDLLFHKSES